MSDTKHFLASWTVWYGIASIVGGWIGVAAGAVTVDHAIELTVNGAAVLGLRIKTGGLHVNSP